MPAPGSPFEEFGVAAALLLLVLLELARRQGVVVAVARRPVPAALGLVLSATLLVPPHLVHAGGGPTGPLVQWVFSDPLGSGVLTTNSNGTQALRRLFEPFGRLEHETDLSGTWPRPQFAGHDEEDAYYATLYDFGARFYDPAVGQFLQVDPLVPDPYHPADLNPYAYVRNDPLNMVDPTGEFVVSVSLGLFFAKVVAGEAIVFGLGAILTATAATAATAVANDALSRTEKRSDVFRSQPGALGDAGEHARADLVAVVEGPDEVREAGALKDLVRAAGLALDRPADAEERGEDARGLGRAPGAHAAAEAVSKWTLTGPRGPSPCSRRSARTRSASAWTWASASSALVP